MKAKHAYITGPMIRTLDGLSASEYRTASRIGEQRRTLEGLERRGFVELETPETEASFANGGAWRLSAKAVELFKEKGERVKTDYVAGFMFDEAFKRVALIRKRPTRASQAWQFGLLNGIGGGIEPGEGALGAMNREFAEETAFKARAPWRNFCTMSGANGGERIAWRVYFFCCSGDIDTLWSPTEEKVVIANVLSINPERWDMVSNLCWLVPMALDFMRDKRRERAHSTVEYP